MTNLKYREDLNTKGTDPDLFRAAENDDTEELAAALAMGQSLSTQEPRMMMTPIHVAAAKHANRFLEAAAQDPTFDPWIRDANKRVAFDHASMFANQDGNRVRSADDDIFLTIERQVSDPQRIAGGILGFVVSLRRSKLSDRLAKHLSTISVNHPDLEILVWEHRPEPNDYQIIASTVAGSFDCDGDRCIPAAAKCSPQVVEGLLHEKGKIDQETSFYLIDEYMKQKWKAFRAQKVSIYGTIYVISLFMTKKNALQSKPVGDLSKTLFLGIAEKLRLLEQLNSYSEKDKRVSKNLHKINSADVAKQFLHDIKDYLHELDDPLTVLRDSNNREPSDVVRANLQIDNYLSEAKELTTAFLQRARENKLKPTPIEIKALLTSTITDFRLRCEGKRIKFVDLVTDKDNIILVDKYHFISVVFNVLNNALYFCDKTPSPAKIELSFDPDFSDNTCALTVLDNGPGIPDIDKALEPGFTTKRWGTGFGLSLADDTLKKHGGAIKIITTVDAYTRVHMEFPKYVQT